MFTESLSWTPSAVRWALCRALTSWRQWHSWKGRKLSLRSSLAGGALIFEMVLVEEPVQGAPADTQGFGCPDLVAFFLFENRQDMAALDFAQMPRVAAGL